MWILSKWLRQRPADLDPYCFQKMINPDHQQDKGSEDNNFVMNDDDCWV